MRSTHAGRWRGYDAALVFLVLMVCFARVSDTLTDPDLYGNIRFGLDHIEAGGLPTEDPYSYLTTGQTWSNHEWAAEWVFAVVYRAAGSTGLILLKSVITLLIVTLAYVHLLGRGWPVLRAGLLILLLTFAMLAGVASVRPQLFTYLGFTLILLAIESADRGVARAMFFLPLIIASWTSFHGGFLAGVGIALIWLFVQTTMWLAKRLRPSLQLTVLPLPFLLVTAVAVALAPLLNPYGVELLTFLWRTATVPRPEIAEWIPIDIASQSGLVWATLAALGIAGVTTPRARSHPALIVVWLVSIVLPWSAVRHLPLAALATVILLANPIAERLRSLRRPDVATNDRRPSPLMVAAIVFLALFMLATASRRLDCIRMTTDGGFAFPVRAVAVLKQAQVEGNAAVFFDWGHYVIWHLAPSVKVSIDGRRETVYSPEVYQRNVDFLYGVRDWNRLLIEPPPDFVLVSRHFPVFALMAARADWQQAYSDSLAGIFVPSRSKWLQTIRDVVPPDVPADGKGMCFP